MSLIDKLEQPTLANVMRDIEQHASSGQLVVKQGVWRVELSFHQGNLMCIGPVRTQATLGERLLAAGIISPQALQETMQAIGDGIPSEARIARTLIELNHVSREALRTWAVERATEVIQPLLSWSQYELSFDENIPLPSDRLFVKIAPSSLLAKPEQVVQRNSSSAQSMPSVPAATPVASPTASGASRPSLPPIVRNSNTDNGPSVQGEGVAQSLPSMHVSQPATSAPNIHVEATKVPRVDIAKVPTLMDSSQFFPDNVPVTPLLRSTDPLMAAVKSSGSAKVPSFISPSSTSSEKQIAFPSPLATQQTPDGTSFAEQEPPSINFPKLLDEQDIPFSSFPRLVDEQDAPSATFALLFDGQEEQAVAKPKPLLSAASMRVDTSFMSGDMVLVPTDMEQLAAQELDIQITPPQWQLFIRADGQTSLSKICVDLRVYREQVYQIAGELMMLGLVQIIPTQVPQGMPQSQVSYPNGPYNAPMSLNAMLPSTPSLGTPNADVQSSFGTVPSFDVQSQGGNRGNGNTFGPGAVWSTPSMPLQSSPNNGPTMATPGNYMPVGGRR